MIDHQNKQNSEFSILSSVIDTAEKILLNPVKYHFTSKLILVAVGG